MCNNDTIVLHSVKQHLNRSPNVVTTRSRSVFRQQPQFMLHSADRHSGESIRSVSLVTTVTRTRIGPNHWFLKSVSTIGFVYSVFNIPSETNQAHSGSGTFGKTSRFCPSSYRSHSEQVLQNRNRTDSASKLTRAISSEPTGCTPTKFVVDSELSLVKQNQIRWHQHMGHRK